VIDTRLNSLLKVVETGSFTKAAEQLSLSQPAVSQHIRQLEETLGVKIFKHSHNRVHLTREGELVVEYARRVAALYRNLEQTLKNEREQIRSLTIGITHTAESGAIIEALADYVSDYEDLNLKIVTGTTDQLYAMLKNFELDFAFVDGPSPDGALEDIFLDTDSLVLAVSPTHRLADRERVTLEELQEERLILRPVGSNTRNRFHAALESRNLSPEAFNVAMEIDSVATIKDLIRRGFGVSVLAKSACMDELRKGKLWVLEIEGLSLERSIYVAYPRSFRHPELLQGIVEQYHRMQRSAPKNGGAI